MTKVFVSSYTFRYNVDEIPTLGNTVNCEIRFVWVVENDSAASRTNQLISIFPSINVSPKELAQQATDALIAQLAAHGQTVGPRDIMLPTFDTGR